MLSSLAPPRSTVYKTQRAWQGVKYIYPIDVNFHFQKSLEIFDKKSADKNWCKKDKGVKSALPHAN